MISEAFNLLLSAILIFALLVFKVTAYQVPTVEGESPADAFKRLWRTYRGNMRSAIISAWFWASAATVTAACIVIVREGG